MYKLVLKLLNKALSDYQAQDKTLPQQLSNVHGRSLKLTIRELPKPFYLIARQQLQLVSAPQHDVDAEVSLSLFTLAELTNTRDISPLIKQDKLIITGDSRLAAKVVEVLQHCHFEPEEWLAGKIGDSPAHLIHRNVLKLLATGKKWKREVALDLHEWMQDEATLLPTAIEVEIFSRNVSQTEQAVDEIELRIQRLREKLMGADN